MIKKIKILFLAAIFIFAFNSCTILEVLGLYDYKPNVPIDFYNEIEKPSLPLKGSLFNLLLPEDSVNNECEKVADFSIDTESFPSFIFNNLVEKSLKKGANLIKIKTLRVDQPKNDRIFKIKGSIYYADKKILDNNIERFSKVGDTSIAKLVFYNMSWEHKHYFAFKHWYTLMANDDSVMNFKRTRYAELNFKNIQDTVLFRSEQLDFYKVFLKPGTIHYLEVEFVPDRYFAVSSSRMGSGYGSSGIRINIGGGPMIQDGEGNYHFSPIYNEKPRKYYINWNGINRGRFESAICKQIDPIFVDSTNKTNMID